MKLTNTNQYELSHTYESAQARVSANPEHAAKHREILDKYGFLKSEEEALEKARPYINKDSLKCQIWANVGKDEEYYHLSDKWIVSDDYDILLAAEYLGFAQVYGNGDLHDLFGK